MTWKTFEETRDFKGEAQAALFKDSVRTAQ